LACLWRRELRTAWQTRKHTTTKLGPVMLLAAAALAPQLAIMATEIIKPLLVNRYLSYLEAGSIALFGMGLKLLMLSNLPMRAVVQVLFPNFAKLHAGQAQEKLKTQVRFAALRMFAATACFAALLWLLAPWVVGLLFGLGNLSADRTELLYAMYRAFLFFAPFATLGLLFQEIGYATKQGHKVLLAQLANIGLLLVMLPTLIQSVGLMGAVYAYVSSQILCMCLMAMFVYLGLKKAR
jgi:O-antigen/teichoic acid export membrane protein